ncbi:MAG TPA: DoxX family protein [Epsilonproteobacteria bacterium]|nr:DoxX family protein [Campylobacterota bacterium]
MREMFAEIAVLFGYGQSLSLLLVRLALAYGFLKPLMLKIKNLPETGLWFESLGIPIPHFFAYLVSGTEAIGIILLVLGLMTRFVSFALGIVMFVAILVVHWPHGFSAEAMGIEIPLYYLLFFFILMTQGGGRFSLDRLFFGRSAS